MKKIFIFLLCLSASIMSFAQTINGLSSLQGGNTATYSISGLSGVKPNCYYWSSSNPALLTIIGANSNPTVSVVCTNNTIPSAVELKLVYFQGGLNPSIIKSISTIPGSTACNFKPTAFSFIIDPSNNDNILFSIPNSPPSIPGTISYSWKIGYSDGTTFTPLGTQGPQASAPLDCDNPIIGAQVEIIRSGCTPVKITLNKAWPIKFGGICSVLFAPKISNENNDEVKLQPMNNIKVSPNPISSTINFNGENLELYKVSIFDDNGNEVVRNAALDGEINIEGKKRGLYFYRITDEKGLIQEGKLIKE